MALRVPVEGFSVRRHQSNRFGGRILVQRAGSEPDQTFQQRIAVPGLVYMGEGTFHRLRCLVCSKWGRVGRQPVPESARYGIDPYVRPQRLVVSYVYAPPFFKNSGALVRNTLGGWKIAGETTIQSGHLLAAIGYNTFNVFGITQDFAQLASKCTLSQVNTSGSVQSKLGNYINQNCFGAYDAYGNFAPTPYPIIGAPEPPKTGPGPFSLPGHGIRKHPPGHYPWHRTKQYRLVPEQEFFHCDGRMKVLAWSFARNCSTLSTTRNSAIRTMGSLTPPSDKLRTPPLLRESPNLP